MTIVLDKIVKIKEFSFFAAGCCTLFTVVGFPGVRYNISNLKGFSRAFTRKRMRTDTTELRSI